MLKPRGDVEISSFWCGDVEISSFCCGDVEISSFCCGVAEISSFCCGDVEISSSSFCSFSRKLSETEDGCYRPKHVVLPC